MSDYVKICPKCTHINIDSNTQCEACDAYLGFTDAIAITDALDKLTGDTPIETSTTHAFYLEASGGTLTYTIYNHTTLGQKHHSSKAEIQVDKINGVEFIHRHHCHFEYKNNTWYITPINQKKYGHSNTNPTFVNNQIIKPGERKDIHNGNRIIFAKVLFHVRIMNTHR